ncbi:MAG TPA: YtxH domain-containing protein [Terriglobales bacterium]|nr:YtxH domain-containing protein [Terriglobales bacterium]
MTDYERIGESQASSRRGAGLAITFLLIGLGAGALAALLFAPDEGKKTRRALRRKYEDALDTFAEWKESAEDLIERGSDFADSAREKARGKVEPLRRVVRR